MQAGSLLVSSDRISCPRGAKVVIPTKNVVAPSYRVDENDFAVSDWDLCMTKWPFSGTPDFNYNCKSDDIFPEPTGGWDTRQTAGVSVARLVSNSR